MNELSAKLEKAKDQKLKTKKKRETHVPDDGGSIFTLGLLVLLFFFFQFNNCVFLVGSNFVDDFFRYQQVHKAAAA